MPQVLIKTGCSLSTMPHNLHQIKQTFINTTTTIDIEHVFYRFLIYFWNKNNYRFTFYHVKFLFNIFQIELFFIFRGRNALDFQRMALFHQCLVGILRHSFWLVEYVCIIQTISLADTSKCHSLVFLALEYRCPLNSDRKFANNFQLN